MPALALCPAGKSGPRFFAPSQWSGFFENTANPTASGDGAGVRYGNLRKRFHRAPNPSDSRFSPIHHFSQIRSAVTLPALLFGTRSATLIGSDPHPHLPPKAIPKRFVHSKQARVLTAKPYVGPRTMRKVNLVRSRTATLREQCTYMYVIDSHRHGRFIALPLPAGLQLRTKGHYHQAQEGLPLTDRSRKC